MILLFIYLVFSYSSHNGFVVVSFVFFDDNHECHALPFNTLSQTWPTSL